jgi:hypothetical protein
MMQPMTWREKTVIRILILIAKIVAPDEPALDCVVQSSAVGTKPLHSLRAELQQLGNHISSGFGEQR